MTETMPLVEQHIIRRDDPCWQAIDNASFVQRGLFRASDGRLIQADVNAAYNVIRKVVPKAFADGIGAAVVQPVRVYPRAN